MLPYSPWFLLLHIGHYSGITSPPRYIALCPDNAKAFCLIALIAMIRTLVSPRVGALHLVPGYT